VSDEHTNDTATTFDYDDGQGPIPAKQHTNPDGSIGGWVAMTATVSRKCVCGIRARTLGYAVVDGSARVDGYAVVNDGEWKTSPLQIQGSAHFVNMASRTVLRIGCIELTIAKWREKRVVLGQANGYTAEQIEEYGLYIELAAKLYPPIAEEEKSERTAEQAAA